MKQFKFRQLLMLAFFASVLFACSNDDDTVAAPDNEEEEITTLQLSLVENGSTTPVVFRYSVIDGEVTENDNIILNGNTNYTYSLEFLNEAETPTEDVTAEVREEGDEHLVCFTPSNVNFIVNRTDSDDNGLEIGLEGAIITGATSTGTLNITLKHQPDLKETSSTENCDLGETDIEVDFDFTIN